MSSDYSRLMDQLETETLDRRTKISTDIDARVHKARSRYDADKRTLAEWRGTQILSIETNYQRGLDDLKYEHEELIQLLEDEREFQMGVVMSEYESRSGEYARTSLASVPPVEDPVGPVISASPPKRLKKQRKKD